MVFLDDNLVCISALIDSSGSMANLDTRELAEGLTRMIKEQTALGKRVVFYGAKFSDNFEVFANGVDGNNIKITKEDIMPDGMTALYPAFGRMIRYTGEQLERMTAARPGKVIFVLLSDGQQTTDQLSFTCRQESDAPYEGRNAVSNLRKKIEDQQNKYNWQFLYLGTNYDAIKEGVKLGISMESCLNYAYTPKGARNAVNVCSQAMGRMQSNTYSGFTENEQFDAMDG
jgi:uncharacterized protein YegL